ncbi:MAG: hypothetical protein JSU87_13540 [Gemmatimonadota bacterium]|nr:MAG: hypothetical protein JSU87_13540 [Gemmatimonadota bacterium]
MNGLISVVRRPWPLLFVCGLGLAFTGCDDDEPIGPGNFPDVRGTWVGQYSVFSCTLIEVGDPFFCDEVFYEGASLIFELDLGQSGSRLDGVAYQGTVSGEVGGRIDELGVLELSGRLGLEDNSTTTITGWSTELVGDSLLGSWSFRIRDNTGSGFATAAIEADILLVDPIVLTFFNCPIEFRLRIGESVDGLLVAGDCMLDDQSYFDVYALNVAAGDDVLISMTSDRFSPFLWVTDLEEEPLAVDGEPGRSVAAITGAAGQRETWLIVANSFAANATGTYQLSIERNAPGAASPTLAPSGGARVSASVVKSIRALDRQDSLREEVRRRLTRPAEGRGER